MDYKNRAKSRKIKRNFEFLVDSLVFKGINLSFSDKIVLFGSLLSFVSLFFTWIEYTSIVGTGFSGYVGSIGYFYIIILAFLVFNTISINRKEKLKLHSSLHFRDYQVTIPTGIFIFISSISSTISIISIQAISNSIKYGNGVILSITAGIIIFVGGIMQMKNGTKSNTGYFSDYMDGDSYEETSKNSKENMRLPF